MVAFTILTEMVPAMVLSTVLMENVSSAVMLTPWKVVCSIWLGGWPLTGMVPDVVGIPSGVTSERLVLKGPGVE